ncbi:nlpC/P60 family protein [Clostridium sp. CAG:590]|nr:nlpC/P60 family protein [Clostridium sp. CAG:590]
MKKNIVRSSMLAVAALSLMLGGTSYTSSVKEQVSETPAIVSKAIENGTSNMKSLEKGTAVQVAEATTEATTEAVTEAPTTEAVSEEVASAEIEQKSAKVDSNQVVANIDSYLNIRSEASEDSEVVGKFYNGNVGTVVEKGDEWSVVSSGNAYGYVKNDYLLFGTDAEQYIESNCDQVAKVTAETLNVRADESTDSEVVTQSDADASLAVLGQDNGWVKVAVSDDQVGYVSSDYVYLDYVYETAVTVEEEQAALAAQEQEEAAAQEAEEQTTEAATTQTTEAPKKESPKKESTKKETVDSTDVVVKDQSTSTETVKQDSSTSASGQAVADYAVQFVGNPYVYGGTSLTKGADCSGFVQSVYKHFGYSLSRTAASQAGDGKKVSVDSLQPGDLLFYHGYGHVAIYIGGGQVVHASNKATGIKISSYDYSPIDKAVRIIY